MYIGDALLSTIKSLPQRLLGGWYVWQSFPSPPFLPLFQYFGDLCLSRIGRTLGTSANARSRRALLQWFYWSTCNRCIRVKRAHYTNGRTNGQRLRTSCNFCDLSQSNESNVDFSRRLVSLSSLSQLVHYTLAVIILERCSYYYRVSGGSLILHAQQRQEAKEREYALLLLLRHPRRATS